MRRALVALALLALASPGQADDRVRVRVLAGASSGVMTGGSPSVEPLARVEVGWDVWKGERGIGGDPRPITAQVVADYSAMPGDAVGFEEPASFRGLRFDFGLWWRAFPSASVQIGCHGAFASRYETGGREPVNEAPKSGGCGVRFSTEGGERNAYLETTFDSTQELDGRFVAAIAVRASLDLLAAEGGSLGGTSVTLVLRATLGLEHSANAPERRDAITAGAVVAWGKRP